MTVALGVVAGVVLGLAVRRRGVVLRIGYGALAGGVVWAAGSVLAGNRAEEMAAIPYLVAAALAFWLVAVPAAAAVIGLELARHRRGGG